MTATYPDTADLRECRLYRFYGWDPRTNYTTKKLIYIGETVQEAFDRLLQHIGRQPWADTITSWEVDDRVFSGKDAVVAAEKAAVEAERPLYSDEWNRGNAERVELEQAKVQRWARDDARGVPRWRPGSSRSMYRRGWEVPVPDNGTSRPYGRIASRPDRASPVRQNKTGLSRRQKYAIGWGIGWLASTITVFVLALRWHLGNVNQSMIGAPLALPALLLTVWLLLLWKAGKRRRRRILRVLTGRSR